MFRLYFEDTTQYDATATALECLRAHHIDGATIYKAAGYWRGTREAAVVLETDGAAQAPWNSDGNDRARVYDLAESIRVALKQSAVAVVETADTLTLVTAPIALGKD